MARDRTIAGLLLVGVATLPACAGDQVVVIRKDHLPWYTADPLLLPSVTAAVGRATGSTWTRS